jgi:hypothetical protein
MEKFSNVPIEAPRSLCLQCGARLPGSGEESWAVWTDVSIDTAGQYSRMFQEVCGAHCASKLSEVHERHGRSTDIRSYPPESRDVHQA